ncbi:MAG: VanZ family protein [Bacteroidales bacterium]|nr:VanZ family protein [Bacteroidales bacterium]
MTKRLSLLFKVVFYLYLVIVAVLCFGNFHSLPSVSKTILGIPTDKVAHFIMFFPFPILAFLAYDKFTKDRKSVILFAIVTLLAGCFLAVGTELGQKLLTDYRHGDPTDALADFIALLSGSVIATWLDLKKLRK